MKRDDRQIAEVPQDDLTAKYPKDSTAKYRLQLVATVAAQLLIGDDYDGAVEKAMALIEACEDELFFRKDGARTQLTFHDALRFVTGQKREDRSLPLYRRFLRDVTTGETRLLTLTWTKDLNELRRDGLSLVEARMQKEQFKKWYARRRSASASVRGKLGAKARSQKKRLDRAN